MSKEFKTYETRYRKIGYSVQAYIPKEVAQHLGLEDKGKLQWRVRKALNPPTVAVRKVSEEET